MKLKIKPKDFIAMALILILILPLALLWVAVVAGWNLWDWMFRKGEQSRSS